MKYAISATGEPVEATRDEKGFCPSCGDELTPRICRFTESHWAHRPGSDCQHTDKPDRAWHEWWLKRLPIEMVKDAQDTFGKRSYIDAVHPNETLITVYRHRPSFDIVREREEKHGAQNLVWIFDTRKMGKRLKFRKPGAGKFEPLSDGSLLGEVEFKWIMPRLLVAVPKGYVFLDLGNLKGVGRRILWLNFLKVGSPAYGKGRLYTLTYTMKWLREGFDAERRREVNHIWRPSRSEQAKLEAVT